jgi:hypothetical protein
METQLEAAGSSQEWTQDIYDLIVNTVDTFDNVIDDAVTALNTTFPKWIGVVDFGLFSDEMLSAANKSMNDIAKAADRANGPTAGDAITIGVDLLKLSAAFKGIDSPDKKRASAFLFSPTKIPQSEFTTFAIYVQTIDTGVKANLPEPFGGGIFLPFSEFGWRYSDDVTITVVKDMRVYIGGINVWGLPFPSPNSKNGFIYPFRLIIEFAIIAIALYLISLNITVAYRAGLYLLTIFGMISTHNFRSMMAGQMSEFSDTLDDVTNKLLDIEQAIEDIDSDAFNAFDMAGAFSTLNEILAKKQTGLTDEQDALLRSIASNIVGKLKFV